MYSGKSYASWHVTYLCRSLERTFSKQWLTSGIFSCCLFSFRFNNLSTILIIQIVIVQMLIPVSHFFSFSLFTNWQNITKRFSLFTQWQRVWFYLVWYLISTTSSKSNCRCCVGVFCTQTDHITPISSFQNDHTLIQYVCVIFSFLQYFWYNLFSIIGSVASQNTERMRIPIQ